MKRDMDVIRQIILSVANSELGELVTEVDGIDNAACAAHAELLIEAGLVIGFAFSPDTNVRMNPPAVAKKEIVPPHIQLVRLTWEGQDFADAIADESVWQAVRKHVIKPAGSFTFSILVDYAKYEIKQRLGIP